MMKKNFYLLIFFTCLFQWRQASALIQWFTPCTDQNFCLTTNGCSQGNVFLVEKAFTTCGNTFINYSYRIDLNNDGSTDIISAQDTVNGLFAKGTHKIVWKATDNCGQQTQCTYLFTVKDCQVPNLLCLNGLTQALGLPDCELKFKASQFILNVSDNCTPNNQLKFGLRILGSGTGFPPVDSIVFGECDLGTNLLEVWVKDGSGLTNQCNNYVIVQPGGSGCNCNPDADVKLKVCAKSAGNTKLSKYTLKVLTESIAGVNPPLTKNTTVSVTDSCSEINVGGLPFEGSYRMTIRGQRTDDPLNGVSTLDLVRMSRHIINVEPLTNFYQVYAADVNKSNSVSTFDIVEIRKLILGIYDTLPAVPSWRLIRPVPDTAQLLSFHQVVDTFQRVINNITTDITLSGTLGWIGIKSGDVNRSASFQEEGSDTGSIPVIFEDRWCAAGETVEVPLYWSEAKQLFGWQLNLGAEADILEADGMESEHFHISGNTIRALQVYPTGRLHGANEPFITLRLRVLNGDRLSNLIRLSESGPSSEVYIDQKPVGMRLTPKPVRGEYTAGYLPRTR